MAIFATVVLYGLTAAPVARLLGVAEATGRVVLVVGGNPSGACRRATLKAAGAQRAALEPAVPDRGRRAGLAGCRRSAEG